MTYQPRFVAMIQKTATNPENAVHMPPRSALEEELALLDCVIPMTCIPELADLDSDEDLTGLNLFSPVMDADTEQDANILRSSSRSSQARGRIVALRRRAMRSRVQRAVPVWPLAGGQGDNDLRAMRDQIYAPCEAEPDQMVSVPLRLATHAISLSLMATALPVGAAVMTYNVLKGEDIKVTARLTTLTGLALVVLAGNPQLAQMIGA